VQIILGDLHGLNTLRHQPIKLAAMEGDWETRRGQPLILFAWPNMAAERNDYALEIPKLGSLLLTHDSDGEVQGLKAVPPAERPYVPIVFWAFRGMAGIGFVLTAIAFCGVFSDGADAFTPPDGSILSAPFQAPLASLLSSAAGR
jgi:cytochrome d ubiquinol oxidase subunit I